MPIVIGLGTGRSGTQSLARLIDAQQNSVCFHETNPACVKWADTPGTIKSMIGEFRQVLDGGPREITIDFTRPAKDQGLDRLQRIETVRTIGDVAFYYLSYAEMLIEAYPEVRMPCIQRDREEVVASFSRAVRLPNRQSNKQNRLSRWLAKPQDPVKQRNHWVNHDGSRWALDPKWDKLFPKFDAQDLEEAVGTYWDYYSSLATRLSRSHPDRLRVFDIEMLNTKEGQTEILGFCGIDEPYILGEFHANKLPI